MGKKATIQFFDVPRAGQTFGIKMSDGSSDLLYLFGQVWGTQFPPEGVSDIDPGYTKEQATINLYNYIDNALPIGTDITISKDNVNVYLFSDTTTEIVFYHSDVDINGVGTPIVSVTSGQMATYANVSAQNWSSTSTTTGSNIINLTWSGASDPENSIKGYDLSYKVGTSTTWISVPFIPTSDGGASYDFVVTQQVTHFFRVRTVDTENVVSSYAYYTQVIAAVFQITSTSINVSACTLGTPNLPVYLTTATPSINGYVYNNSTYTSGFDGTRLSTSTAPGSTARNWKIGTPTNIFYSCTIDAVGKITTNPVLCTSQYNNGLISNSASTELNACTRNIIATNNIYWNISSDLVIGTTLYTNTGLTTTVLLGCYHILYTNPTTQLDSEYIVTLNSSGKITSIRNYSPFCDYTPPSGGSGGGAGCVDPLVSILLPNGITKFAGEVKVNDIILTIHEITKELGEFKVLSKKVVTQPKVIVKFTDGTEIKVSDTHKFLMSDDTWKQIFSLKGSETIKGLELDKTIKEITRIGEGDVVMFEIEEAHTYISDGLISHNLKIYYGQDDTLTYNTLP